VTPAEKFEQAKRNARKLQVKQILEAIWRESLRIEPTNVFTYFLATATAYTLEHGPGTIAEIVFVVKVSSEFIQTYLEKPSDDWESFAKRMRPFVFSFYRPTYFTEKPNHFKGVLQ